MYLIVSESANLLCVQDYIWTVPGENSLETPRGKM